MQRSKEELRAEAVAIFLGRETVIGVGIQASQSAPIVFLLRARAPAIEDEITAWAHGCSIEPAFQVTGEIEASSGVIL